jgi:hypothetical protein
MIKLYIDTISGQEDDRQLFEIIAHGDGMYNIKLTDSMHTLQSWQELSNAVEQAIEIMETDIDELP